jgi:hypothetical protein
MVDPAAVGRKLAKQIRYTGPLVTPDFGTAIGIRVIRLFPEVIGK